MRRSLAFYQLVENVIGRRNAWRIGRWLYLGSRRELLNDPRWNGEYALQDWMLVARPQHIAGNDVFIDVGANIGEWTQNLLDKLEKAQHLDVTVHAFEPAPAQREVLAQRQTAKSRILLVDPRGLGAAPGKFRFHITGEATGTSVLLLEAEQGDISQTIDIDVTTLDAIATEQGYAWINLVKIDTEGNDFNVILGAQQLFDEERIQVLQFEYNWRWIGFGHWLKEVFQFLEGRPYFLGRLTQTGIELYGEWHPELDRYIETNYVILHHQYCDRLPTWFASFDSSNIPERSPPRDYQARSER